MVRGGMRQALPAEDTYGEGGGGDLMRRGGGQQVRGEGRGVGAGVGAGGVEGKGKPLPWILPPQILLILAGWGRST